MEHKAFNSMCLRLYKFSFPGPKGRKRWFHMCFMAVDHSFAILWERGEGGNLYSSDTGVSICSTQVADLVSGKHLSISTQLQRQIQIIKEKL